ncbi:hypothetical protein PIB30_031826 [Stylosanthes scabra]|uniref:Uncharacterized protein n=1 Tax=Stylosanthes scabra TaxID=79078 RepID=A0ABU6RCM0_9FABA|nr:hypothetical protein [Stylosanthes scabra]
MRCHFPHSSEWRPNFGRGWRAWQIFLRQRWTIKQEVSSPRQPILGVIFSCTSHDRCRLLMNQFAVCLRPKRLSQMKKELAVVVIALWDSRQQWCVFFPWQNELRLMAYVGGFFKVVELSSNATKLLKETTSDGAGNTGIL